MEDSIMKVIEMSLAATLFIFALSLAVFSYNKINANSDILIGTNIINRRGTATSQKLEENDVHRKTDISEIIFAICDMIKATSVSSETYKVEIKIPRYNQVMSVTYSSIDNILYVNSTHGNWKFNHAENISLTQIYSTVIPEFIRRYCSHILNSKFTISYESGYENVNENVNIIFTEV